MGASLWSYVVDDANVQTAFRSLQAKLLESTGGGTREARLTAAGEDGTHSILDMRRVVEGPPPPPLDYAAMFTSGADGAVIVTDGAFAQLTESIGSIYEMSEAELLGCFETSKPGAADVASFMVTRSRGLSQIERGTGRFAVLYDGDQPNGVWFVGISGD